jgi:L-ascorbate metabolism protein UlaG (beta-lactamase superfamily)
MPPTRRQLFLSFAALGGLAAAGVSAVSQTHRYYDGPISDHFDGLRFHDPHGAPPKSVVELLRWRVAHSGEPWPERSPSRYADRPPARVDSAAIRISYIGHASLLLQTAGVNILIDPVWSDRISPFSFAGPKRVNDPGIDFDALPPVDAVLVSHGHYDHLDAVTLSQLATRHRPRVITPLGNDTIMRSYDTSIAVEAHDWHTTLRLAPGVTVTLVPLRHWSARGLLDRNKSLWAGFVIETPGGRICHVTDSGYGDGYRFREARQRYGPFRLAILPIGAYEPRWFMRDQHMNPEEAVKAFIDCGAEFALAHHFGTFKLSDEAIDAPVETLKAACAAAGIGKDRFKVLVPGQMLEL